jgi:hypothetical protein
MLSDDFNVLHKMIFMLRVCTLKILRLADFVEGITKLNMLEIQFLFYSYYCSINLVRK